MNQPIITRIFMVVLSGTTTCISASECMAERAIKKIDRSTEAARSKQKHGTKAARQSPTEPTTSFDRPFEHFFEPSRSTHEDKWTKPWQPPAFSAKGPSPAAINAPARTATKAPATTKDSTPAATKAPVPTATKAPVPTATNAPAPAAINASLPAVMKASG